MRPFRYLLPLILFFSTSTIYAAPDTLRVLFVGNSYVQVNNLPDIIAQMAANQGDVLIKTDASVGGYTFEGHYTNPGTLVQIARKGWDFVVLQEQSQIPAFPDAQVAAASYPYARALDSLVHLTNPCAKTTFYMTWGRKNGDAANCSFFPLICTYNGMDSLLQARYKIMAQNNQALLSPVGLVWHKMRDLYPGVDLYQADESHPTEAGSYLAAATFYTMLFKKDPTKLTYNFNLNATDAANIRQLVKAQVWDSLSKWYQYRPVPAKPSAGFSQTITGTAVQFKNSSAAGIRYLWLFGDGKSDTAASPKHIYASNGAYSVRLIAINCDGVRDTLTRSLIIGSTGINNSYAVKDWSVYPNPATSVLHIDGSETPANISLFDIAGRVSLSIMPGEKTLSLNVHNLAAGTYLLRIDLANGRTVKQLISIAK